MTEARRHPAVMDSSRLTRHPVLRTLTSGDVTAGHRPKRDRNPRVEVESRGGAPGCGMIGEPRGAAMITIAILAAPFAYQQRPQRVPARLCPQEAPSERSATC
jgi:hypothetical protein